VGIQVKPQLQQDEFQGLELAQRAADGIGSIYFQVKGQVETGEEGAIAQSVIGLITLGTCLLKGDIGNCQRGALRQGTAAVGAGRLICSLIGIQCVFLLGN
jgi:hypothetical protein